MDAERFIDRILDDEGLTSGVTDDVAKKLLHWLTTRIELKLAPLKDAKEAEKVVTKLKERIRSIAKAVELFCGANDATKANETLKSLGYSSTTAALNAKDPAAVVDQLLAWETKANA